MYVAGALRNAELAVVAGGADLPFYAWLYPPQALLVVYPLAAMPYLAAFAVAMSAGIAVVGVVVASATSGWRAQLGLTFAAPAMFLCVTHGQLSLLAIGLLGASLALLRSSPWLSGILVGLASFKPQLGLLFPVALLAGRHGRAFLSATAAAVLLAWASWLAFGPDVFRQWLGALPGARAIVEDGAVEFSKQASVLAAGRVLGLPAPYATALQGVALVCAAGAVGWAWRNVADPALQNAVLVTAAVLGSPFVLVYDHLLVVLALAWLVATWRRTAPLPWEVAVAAFAWAAPLLAMAVRLPLAAASSACLLALLLRRAVSLPSIRDARA